MVYIIEKDGFSTLISVKTNNISKKTSFTTSPTSSKVLVNGTETAFNAYTIDGSNYFKLRDLAFVVNGTNKNFNIGYDDSSKAVTITSEHAYINQGNELAKGDGKTKTYTKSVNSFFFNGVKVNIDTYMIDGNNFVKLRDVMKLLNIGITYDAKTKTIGINTNIDYID